jgi:hypothetical protein
MHPTSIGREKMMVSGQIEFNAAIHTPLLTFIRSLGTYQSTCGATFNVDLTVLWRKRPQNQQQVWIKSKVCQLWKTQPMHRLCTQLRTYSRWTTQMYQGYLSRQVAFQWSGQGVEGVGGTCLEVLSKGAERGLGHEGERTRKLATLNCRKSYSIIANNRS